MTPQEKEDEALRERVEKILIHKIILLIFLCLPIWGKYKFL